MSMSVTERGRRIVMALAGMALTSSATVILLYVVLRGTDRIPAQFLRFVMTCVVWVCLYNRVPAARWVAVILYAIGAVTEALSGQILEPAVLILATIHASIAGTLAFSPSVDAHFRARRNAPQ